MKGKIRRYFEERGFGFIRPHDRSPDLFFHFSGSPGVDFEALGNAEVEFDTAPDKRDLGAVRAINIRPMGDGGR